MFDIRSPVFNNNHNSMHNNNNNKNIKSNSKDLLLFSLTKNNSTNSGGYGPYNNKIINNYKGSILNSKNSKRKNSIIDSELNISPIARRSSLFTSSSRNSEMSPYVKTNLNFNSNKKNSNHNFYNITGTELNNKFSTFKINNDNKYIEEDLLEDAETVLKSTRTDNINSINSKNSNNNNVVLSLLKKDLFSSISNKKVLLYNDADSNNNINSNINENNNNNINNYNINNNNIFFDSNNIKKNILSTAYDSESALNKNNVIEANNKKFKLNFMNKSKTTATNIKNPFRSNYFINKSNNNNFCIIEKNEINNANNNISKNAKSLCKDKENINLINIDNNKINNKTAASNNILTAYKEINGKNISVSHNNQMFNDIDSSQYNKLNTYNSLKTKFYSNLNKVEIEERYIDNKNNEVNLNKTKISDKIQLSNKNTKHEVKLLHAKKLEEDINISILDINGEYKSENSNNSINKKKSCKNLNYSNNNHSISFNDSKRSVDTSNIML